MLLGQTAQSQQICLTEPGPEAIGQLFPNQGNVSNTSGPYFIRLYVHVIRRSDGTGGYTPEEVDQALEILDKDFNPHSIFFVRDCDIDYIDSNYYYNNHYTSMYSQNRHIDGIDLYLQPPHPGQPGGRGRARGIPGDALYLFGSYEDYPLALSHVISHEMGHCLGLYHTHHPHEPFAIGCDELVNQSNCSTCGDYVCDTPADPNMNYSANNDCEWTGSGFDANLQPYNPDEKNVMAYIDPGCMRYFTEGQGLRMRQVIATAQILQDRLVEPDIVGQTIVANTIWTTTNTPNNGDFLIEGDLVVSEGATLTISAGVRVRFGVQSKLIIKPNGRLIHYGTLTSMGCGNHSWPGVQVWGSNNGQSQYTVNGVRAQGRVECKEGSLIENAGTGIQLYGPTYQFSGGQISCSGGEIKNCQTGIEFAPYHNFWPFATSQQGQPRNYFGSMTRMAFSVDEDYPHDTPFHSFIRMTGVNGINVTGCSFINSMNIRGNEIADWGYGIFANDAGFSVQAAANGISYPPVSYTHSEFRGLGYGIYTAKVLENRPFLVKQSDFSQCFVGVRVRSVSGGTLLLNNFILEEVPAYVVSNEQVGISFEYDITGFTCQENNFVNTGGEGLTTIGIFCDNTGDQTKVIRKNTFSGLNVGNLANGQNGANPAVDFNAIRGLNYLCNRNFNVQVNGADFDVASGWIRNKQGEIISNPVTIDYKATGNRFSYTGTDFINSGSGAIEYFYDQLAANQIPLTYGGAFTSISTVENLCPTDYCEPPCKDPQAIDLIKTAYYTSKNDYLATQVSHVANPTEEKQLEMARQRQIMDEAAYMVVLHQLYDTVAYHRDTLTRWIGKMNSVAAELWLADLHLASGDAAKALQLLDSIPNNYNLSIKEQSDVQIYRNIASVLVGQPIYELNTTTLASIGYYDQSGGNAGGLAQNILTLYGAHYPAQYQFSPGSGQRSAPGHAEVMHEPKNRKEYLLAQPNPASNYVEFRLQHLLEVSGTKLLIMDVGGRIVQSFNLSEEDSLIRWDAEANPSGVYFYQLITPSGVLQSGKVILNK